ncbi:CidA/LrgA family protein [Xenophilus arseniciresistens]|uniref:CidA/LrgA family protein n=1 Tax=Xenophilus arseniciresistens TaxID=1283306 RepID=A0AAE3NDL0_9BURK|nr:CidA/LrgA family protein [Xenophilus arseniciresistens]MDA7418287.1 CidA/LrgA family protein [Xenophilus arseniciresistens]
MLQAFALLLLCQLAGDAVTRLCGLPLPGAVLGLIFLLLGLLALGRVPQALGECADKLLPHMMLLFMPSVAGVMLHFERVAREWQPFLIASVAGSVITLAVTALTLRWLLRRMGHAAAHEGPAATAPQEAR